MGTIIEQPENVEGLTVTLNKMGYMLTYPDQYNQAFIEFASTIHGPCLEIGAAYGVATLPALAKGATIVANDLSEQHLQILKSKVPDIDLPRLQLKPGRLPQDLDFVNESFTGILCSRVLHFIQPELLNESLRKIFNWLRKGGKFFVVATSPYTNSYRDYLPIYQKKKQAGEPRPGFLRNLEDYAPQHTQTLPDFINFLDQDDLVNLLEGAGFIIEKVGFSPIEKAKLSNGREQVGAIAIKP